MTELAKRIKTDGQPLRAIMQYALETYESINDDEKGSFSDFLDLIIDCANHQKEFIKIAQEEQYG
jgi:hypothetical protein